MRTLIALGALQTIGIAVLVVQAFRDHPRTAPQLHQSNPVAAESAAPSLDEQLLRTIIREELTLLQVQDVASPTIPPQSRDAAIDLQQRDAIDQQIESFRALGSITDAQMQLLQADIAKLDGASRKEMLSKLLRALNSGDIKGRLQ